MVGKLLPVVLALALAGCGQAAHHRAPPTRAVFDAKANRACAEATTRSELYAGLRRLRAPAGDEEVYARWLRAVRDTLGTTKSPIDPAILLAASEGKAAGYARRLGARTCELRRIGTMPP